MTYWAGGEWCRRVEWELEAYEGGWRPMKRVQMFTDLTPGARGQRRGQSVRARMGVARVEAGKEKESTSDTPKGSPQGMLSDCM